MFLIEKFWRYILAWIALNCKSWMKLISWNFLRKNYPKMVEIYKICVTFFLNLVELLQIIKFLMQFKTISKCQSYEKVNSSASS